MISGTCFLHNLTNLDTTWIVLLLYPVVMDILRSGNKETGNLPQASHENSSVSPLGAARLKGTLANFHAWPSGDIKSPYLRISTVSSENCSTATISWDMYLSWGCAVIGVVIFVYCGHHVQHNHLQRFGLNVISLTSSYGFGSSVASSKRLDTAVASNLGWLVFSRVTRSSMGSEYFLLWPP